MQSLIRNVDNIIVQVTSDNLTFTVSPEFSWVSCPEDCLAYYWTYDGETFMPEIVEPLDLITVTPDVLITN